MSSSESLRKAMVTLVINKRSEKVQQKIAQQVSQTLKEWETVLNGYVNITAQLNTLTKLAEQQNQITGVRQTLKECIALAKMGTDTFENIWRFILVQLPISTMDHSWMASILKHEHLLVEIKESLSSLLLFSSDREVIEVVQKMMLQITEVQTKINLLSTKVNESVGEIFRVRSEHLDEMDKVLDTTEGDDDSAAKDNKEDEAKEEEEGASGRS